MVSLSKKISKSFLYLSAAVLLNSCGSDEDAATGSSGFTFKDSQFTTVSGSPTATTTDVSGDASFVANTPAGAVTSGSHYVVKSTLEAGSSVTLFAYADDKNANGVSLKFENSSSALKVTMSHGGTDKDITSSFSGKSATEIAYGIDVHNGEGDSAHILIWDSSVVTVSEDNALFNSEGGTEAGGNGAGAYWGIELKDNAKLTEASRGEAKFEED